MHGGGSYGGTMKLVHEIARFIRPGIHCMTILWFKFVDGKALQRGRFDRYILA
jgi:hypothetical protein